jgi:hypothetical protein
MGIVYCFCKCTDSFASYKLSLHIMYMIEMRTNFNRFCSVIYMQSYVKNFGDGEGKVWEGGYGCPAPLNAAHLIGTTERIEELRPKSPSMI